MIINNKNLNENLFKKGEGIDPTTYESILLGDYK